MFLLVFSWDSLIVYMKKKVMIPKYSSDSWLALFFTAYTDKSPFFAKCHMSWNTENLLRAKLRQIFSISTVRMTSYKKIKKVEKEVDIYKHRWYDITRSADKCQNKTSNADVWPGRIPDRETGTPDQKTGKKMKKTLDTEEQMW